MNLKLNKNSLYFQIILKIQAYFIRLDSILYLLRNIYFFKYDKNLGICWAAYWLRE